MALAALLPLAATADGDAKNGRVLTNTCLGCHAIENYRTLYPMYKVPKLGGQNEAYLVAALKAYRDGARTHKTMHAQAATLSDQEMADVAAYFASRFDD
ncbi:MAG: c-type cytochrome [Gammaproteobacteria bacterium]|nr:MAG: c-type cytochrome [Gammaproteobacteria bacterium]